MAPMSDSESPLSSSFLEPHGSSADADHNGLEPEQPQQLQQGSAIVPTSSEPREEAMVPRSWWPCSLSIGSSAKKLRTLSLKGVELPDDSEELARSISWFTALDTLDLSHCRLSHLPVLTGLANLTHFDASSNLLESSIGLHQCTALRRLLLRYNRLHRVERLEPLVNLEELDVAWNLLGPTPGMAFHMAAACYERLRAIHVQGNPFAEVSAHPRQLADMLPALQFVDGQPVCPGVMPPSKKSLSATKANSGFVGALHACYQAEPRTTRYDSPTEASVGGVALHHRRGFRVVGVVMLGSGSTASLPRSGSDAEIAMAPRLRSQTSLQLPRKGTQPHPTRHKERLAAGTRGSEFPGHAHGLLRRWSSAPYLVGSGSQVVATRRHQA